jgi:hypothetical protein
MKKDYTRLIISIFCSFLGLTLLTLISCGGGGGDSTTTTIAPTVTPPTQNIVGTYSLRSFIIKYSDGGTVTEKNFPSFSGTMKFGANTYSQSGALGDVSSWSNTGTYSITYTQGTSAGIFHITDSSGTYDVSFSISGNILTTDTGILPSESGLTFEEWITWEKTSDVIGIVTEPVEDQKNESKSRYIADILKEMNLINSHK